MKILLATYWPIPHVGGVWYYMEHLQKKMESLGHEVDLLGFSENYEYVYIVNQEDRRIEKDKLLPLLKAKLVEEKYPALYENPLVHHTEFHSYVYELGAAYLGLEKYDVINTQDVISTACINRVRHKETPLVATLHGSVAHEIRHQLTTIHNSPTSYMARAYFDELEHVAATSGEFTIVANEWLKGILTNEFQVPVNQIKVCHYGYDIENFLKKMKEKSSIRRPANKKVILYTGRLTELKGVHHLISALSQLKELRKDWVCWIVGTGESAEEFQAKSKDLDLEDDVFFLGNRDDIPYLLDNSDIFVLPSLIENQPLSVIEAQIAGKAVIVSDAGGLPEIVKHSVTGLVSPKGNSEALCENLNLLLKDEKYRKNLGSNAKKWGMNHWALTKGVKNVLNIYNSAISKKRKGEENGSTDNIH
ncbi:glycosyltransferase family 4 protein [Priestia megaterium]|uniref:glycosyltransferase family 4 protein n=1 Tax=Priestia megaterium TaxID=1404 RepID=UPI00203D530F|nr:glycosyltransferase family 4 protein [Priestia megaterium]MCM3197163.1 glycosyltransferase family 4 protein [Priestia megaterium]